jgi:hypothetical protein
VSGDRFEEFIRRAQAAQAAVDAIIADANAAHAMFASMRTEELERLRTAHRRDLETAETPESLTFGAGRLALIDAVLKTRAATPTKGRS